MIERYAIRLERDDGLRLRKANRIKTIHSSLDIEGNTISEDAVRDILEGKMVVAPMREIKEVFSDENTIVETLFTEYAGHATELAKNAANNGYDVVLSVGGDGNPHISATEIASVTGITKRGVEKQIKKLRELNLITRQGSAKNGLWIINKNFTPTT